MVGALDGAVDRSVNGAVERAVVTVEVGNDNCRIDGSILGTNVRDR